MRQQEQDSKRPAEASDDESNEASSCSSKLKSGTDKSGAGDEEDDEVSQKNFMTRLYEDENFVREKEALEEQIMMAAQVTAESKSFIQEMDEFLKDLEQWKKTRAE